MSAKTGRTMANSTSDAPASSRRRGRGLQDRTIAAGPHADSFPSFDDVVVDLDNCGADDNDEERREDAEDHREEHLDGRLLSLLLDELALGDTRLGRLGRRIGPIGTPKVSACTGPLGRSAARPHRCVDRWPPVPLYGRRPYAPLREPGELLPERAGHRNYRPAECLVEAKSGLDADHEQLDHNG